MPKSSSPLVATVPITLPDQVTADGSAAPAPGIVTIPAIVTVTAGGHTIGRGLSRASTNASVSANMNATDPGQMSTSTVPLYVMVGVKTTRERKGGIANVTWRLDHAPAAVARSRVPIPGTGVTELTDGTITAATTTGTTIHVHVQGPGAEVGPGLHCGRDRILGIETVNMTRDIGVDGIIVVIIVVISAAIIMADVTVTDTATVIENEIEIKIEIEIEIEIEKRTILAVTTSITTTAATGTETENATVIVIVKMTLPILLLNTTFLLIPTLTAAHAPNLTPGLTPTLQAQLTLTVTCRVRATVVGRRNGGGGEGMRLRVKRSFGTLRFLVDITNECLSGRCNDILKKGSGRCGLRRVNQRHRGSSWY